MSLMSYKPLHSTVRKQKIQFRQSTANLDNRQQPQGKGAAAAGKGHRSPNVTFGGQSHAVAGYLIRSLGLCVEVEVFHPGRRVCVEVFASFGMLQRQQTLSSPDRAR